MGVHFGHLVVLKARLTWRSFVRRGGALAVLAVVSIGAFAAPMWVGFAAFAYNVVLRGGADGFAAVALGVQLGWLTSAFLFAAFAEGFEWRVLLRYPIAPRTIFWINVFLAPFDVVALFLLPPLGAAVVALGKQAGWGAACGGALAAVAIVLLTAAMLQVALAGMAGLLRREWARAAVGLVFGLVCAAPALVFHRQVTAGHGLRATLETFYATAIDRPAALAAMLPTTALPLKIVHGAMARSASAILLGLAGSMLVLAMAARLGTRLAVAAALRGENAGDGGRRTASKRVGEFAPSVLHRVSAALVGAQLAILVARELRYWLRTPQILIGLMLTPAMAVFFVWQGAATGPVAMFLLPFICLASVLNLSSNQFGLDRDGVRLLFLLPLSPRSLLVAKNLGAGVVVGSELAISALFLSLLGAGPGAAGLAVAAFAALAALPAILIVGNFLSVAHPWRMTFRVGGTPPGAMASALAQFAALGGMAALIAIPFLLARVLGGPGAGMKWPVLGVAVIAMLAWGTWGLLLGPAARFLTSRQEQLLAVLAHPHETG